jgi:TonB family protein
VCIAPAGHVTNATITQTSSSPAFDAALLHDIADWKFAATPGPANLQSCRVATVVYRS